VEFESSSVVGRPAGLIVETMIERLEVVVPFLDNVERIETLERTPLDEGRVRVVRRWQGTLASVPRAVRPFVSEALLAWIDTAVWTREPGRVEWSHATCAASFVDLYRCAGTNFFEPDPGDPLHRTRIRITGQLDVHPDRLPGVPGFLARGLAPQVEAFIVGLITPNLTGLAGGLQRYFDQRGA
jgi:hypothetical protein